MGLIKGGLLRITSTALYFITLCAATIMVGATGWFLGSFQGSKRDFAIIGIAAVSMAYSLVATLLTCCLAGITFFALLGAIMDFLLFGAMVGVTVLYRRARFGCPNDAGNTCRLYVATWVLAIISLVAYLINAIVSIIMRSRKSTTTPRRGKTLY